MLELQGCIPHITCMLMYIFHQHCYLTLYYKLRNMEQGLIFVTCSYGLRRSNIGWKIDFWLWFLNGFLRPGSCRGSSFNLAAPISFHALSNSEFTVIQSFDFLWLLSEHKWRVIAVIWNCDVLHCQVSMQRKKVV